MVRYVAKHHVGLHNYTARPGELIEEPLDEETVQRLLGLKAIEPVNLPEEPKQPENPFGQADDEGQKNDEGQEPPEAAEDQEPAEFEDAPAPEIDAMDGISAVQEEAPKEKTSKKKARNGGEAK